MEEVNLPAVDCLRPAQEIAGQVEDVDDLLHHLAAALLPHSPPGGVQGIAEVTGDHEPWRAGRTIGQSPLQVFDGLAEAEHEPHLRFDSPGLHGLGHLAGQAQVQGDGLLDEDVHSMLSRQLHLVGVGEGGQADVDQVQICPPVHGPVVGGDLRLPAGVPLVEPLGPLTDDVAQGDELNPLQLGEEPGVVVGDTAAADDSCAQLVHSISSWLETVRLHLRVRSSYPPMANSSNVCSESQAAARRT